MVLAEISDISLDINYANLFQHEAALARRLLRGVRGLFPLARAADSAWRNAADHPLFRYPG
jgi:hypothetical protein